MKPEEIKQLVQEEVKKALEKETNKIIHHSQITPKLIKQRHIQDMVIKRGLDADRPTDGGAVGVYAYFGTDNDTLGIWNGTAWVEEVLT